MEESSVELPTNVVVDLTEKTPIRVLHVDDEVGFLKTAKPCLEMQGAFQVETASSVEEAMEKMKEKTYDAIVCDYIMPSKDGLQFLKELRDGGNNIPFIIFTGKGREDVAIEALNLGADQYFSKIGSPETVYSELAHGIIQAVERRRAEARIKESEEELRSIFDATIDGIAYMDASGKILAANKRLVEEMLGYRLEDTIGKDFSELGRIEPKQLPRVLNAMAEVIATGKPAKNLEVTLVRKDGSKVPTEISTGVVKKDGKVAGITTVVRDITERKKTEEGLTRLSTAVNASRDGIIVCDMNGNVVDVNEAVLKKHGIPRKADMIGRNASEFIAPEDQEKVLVCIREMTKKGQIENVQYHIITKDGRKTLVEANGVVMKDKDGEPIGFVTTVRDITERKRAEKTLRESEEKFERLFIGNPEASAYVDSAFHILDVNPRFEELFGYPLNEIKGKHINDVIVPQDKMKEADTLDKKAKKGYVYYDTVRKRKDGSLVHVSISAAPVLVEGQRLEYVGVYKDITARKKAEEELEKAKSHFQKLFNLLVDPVAIVDGRGKILEVTRKVEEVTGFKRDELVGKNFLRTKIATAKSKAVMIENLAKRMMGMRISPYEVEMLTKDGKKLPYEINAAKIEYKGKRADLVVFRDISERKRMEEKLRVLGVLTRHDVRNKLSAVAGNVYLARKKLPENHEVLKHLNEIESAVEQAMRIFDFAKTYEKLGTEELRYMDVAETFEEAASLFSELKSVKVINYCRGLKVIADSLLRQLFFNLIHNSLQHGEKVSQIAVHYEEKGEKELKLVYEDNGVGIPKAEKEKIFMKGYGKGTGYGLHLIRKMCEVYGWTIRETGKHGKGAQFTITIPKTGKNGKPSYQLSRNR